MKVPHSPFKCLWREWLMPLLFSDTEQKCKEPGVCCWRKFSGSIIGSDDTSFVIDECMCEVMLSFILDNVFEFKEWLKYNKNKVPSKQTGIERWQRYIKEKSTRPQPRRIVFQIEEPALIMISGFVGLAIFLGIFEMVEKIS